MFKWISRWLDDMEDEKHLKPTFLARVSRGANMLDANRPGWFHVLHDKKVAMQKDGQDILSLLYGGCQAGATGLGIADYQLPIYGFAIVWNEYRTVNRAWKREIKTRMDRYRQSIATSRRQALKPSQPIPDNPD